MIPELFRKVRFAVGWWVLPAPRYRVDARLEVIEREVESLSRKDTYQRDRIRNQAELLVRELGLERQEDE